MGADLSRSSPEAPDSSPANPAQRGYTVFHRALLSLSLLSLSIACANAAETNRLDTPRLAGIDNFRDIAGTTTAYTTLHDGVMRSGVFYRSNALTPGAPTWRC